MFRFRPVAVAIALVLAASAVGCSTPPATEESGASLRTPDEAIRADLERMARQFIDREPMDAFEPELLLDEAYRWQLVFAEATRPAFGGIAGYKTGGHDSGARNPNFPPEGVRGLLLEGMIEPSGTAIRPDDTVWGFLEADLLFRVRDDSINAAATDLEILAGLDAVMPFVEIPDPAFVDNRRSVTGTIVTNMATRFAFVGEPVTLDATDDWLQRLNAFTFSVHDETGREFAAGAIAGHYEPMRVVAWLRDQLRASDIRLARGDLLSLGSLGITSPLKPDSPRGGPAYAGRAFELRYHGLTDAPATVTVHITR